MEKIINIIASIGTFGAAIIAYVTLLEIKKQRLSAQRPQLLFKNLAIGYLDIRDVLYKVPLLWTGAKENLKKHILFDMINAGQDIAKNIEFEYKLDVDSFIRLIVARDENSVLNIRDTNDWLYFKSKNGSIDRMISKKVNSGVKDKLEYLLTRSVQDNPSGFAIPEEYLLLNSCLLYLSYKHDFTLLTDTIPKIFVKTSFEDISGHKEFVYQSIETYYPNVGEYSFILKTISKKDFYAA